MSPRQYKTARTIAKPVAPFNIMLIKIALGTFMAALSISSDIWQQSAASFQWTSAAIREQQRLHLESHYYRYPCCHDVILTNKSRNHAYESNKE